MARGKKKPAFQLISDTLHKLKELDYESLTEQELENVLGKLAEITKKCRTAKKDAAFNTEKIALEKQMKELYKKYGKKQ